MSTSSLYFFLFGRNPKLSLAELLSYLSRKSTVVKNHFLDKNFIILEIKENFNPYEAIKDLAGIVKISKIYLTTDESSSIYDELQHENFYFEDTKNLNYSLTCYGKNFDEQSYFGIFKRIFKELKQKAVVKKPTPSSLWNALQKKDFVDIIVCKMHNTIFFGRTLVSSNIKQYKTRYEQRPHVDESIGSSIRFSKILINLSQQQGKLLDPFCGIGTLLQEAILMGFDVSGSELKAERVKFSKINLKWIIQQNNLRSAKFDVIQSDVKDLDKKLPKNSFDTIVTEPELGPLLKKTPTYTQAQSIINSLEDLYISTFRNVNVLLKTNGTFIIVLPQIITLNQKKIKPDLHKLLSNTQLHPISELNLFGIIVPFPLIYHEKWHKLFRLIYLFRKQ